jgi:hypothetical protein
MLAFPLRASFIALVRSLIVQVLLNFCVAMLYMNADVSTIHGVLDPDAGDKVMRG